MAAFRQSCTQIKVSCYENNENENALCYNVTILKFVRIYSGKNKKINMIRMLD